MMEERLVSCHLCGAMMGSNSPICPKCFARADPEMRDAVRLQLQLQAEESERIREKQFFDLLKAFGIIIVLSAVGLLFGYALSR